MSDPLELMEVRYARLIDEWNEAQRGVPEGNIPGYLVQLSWRSARNCYDCLPLESKKSYDKFEARSEGV